MELSAYEQLGVSAKKADVHQAVASISPGLFPSAFCRIGEDVLGNDPNWCCATHADDAGTKVLVAYLVYRETGDPRVFRGIAHDALVMNLDDLLCIGAVDRFVLSNTINRNRFHVPGEVVSEIIQGYQESIERLASYGIRIVMTGGETADMVDVVRTLVVGATMTSRLPRRQVIDNGRIRPGDVIVGLSSTGQATYEEEPNSGIGDNGLTLARHALLCREYSVRFPQTVAPEVDPELVYRGPFRLSDRLPDIGTTAGMALLSPTRTYAPIVRRLVDTLGEEIHGLVHCTGGGQTKCRHFGHGIAYVKDNLFACPPLFRLIAEHGRVSWPEMYQTFNMGHRFEVFVPDGASDAVLAASREFGVEAQIVGRCLSAQRNTVEIDGEFGRFEYGSEC